MVYSITWTIPEIHTTSDCIEHKSELHSCYIHPFRRFRFYLLLKIREDSFEILIESLNDKAVHLEMELFIECNGQKRDKHFDSFPIMGKFEGLTQYEPLLQGGMSFFGAGRRGRGYAHPREQAPPSATIHLNIFTGDRYPKPSFLSEDDMMANNSLRRDMLDAFTNGTGADLTIACKGREFRCQSGILSARSDVFDAMFAHEFEERRTSRVEIEDMSPEALEQLLRFLYTDTVEDMDKHSMELMIASNKYNLPRLKILCEQNLCSQLKDENIIETLLVSQMHNATNAKKFCIKAIVQNFPEVIQLPEWEGFVKEHPDLLTQIHSDLATKMLDLGEESAGMVVPPTPPGGRRFP